MSGKKKELRQWSRRGVTVMTCWKECRLSKNHNGVLTIKNCSTYNSENMSFETLSKRHKGYFSLCDKTTMFIFFTPQTPWNENNKVKWSIFFLPVHPRILNPYLILVKVIILKIELFT